MIKETDKPLTTNEDTDPQIIQELPTTPIMDDNQ